MLKCVNLDKWMHISIKDRIQNEDIRKGLRVLGIEDKTRKIVHVGLIMSKTNRKGIS